MNTKILHMFYHTRAESVLGRRSKRHTAVCGEYEETGDSEKEARQALEVSLRAVLRHRPTFRGGARSGRVYMLECTGLDAYAITILDPRKERARESGYMFGRPSWREAERELDSYVASCEAAHEEQAK